MIWSFFFVGLLIGLALALVSPLCLVGLNSILDSEDLPQPLPDLLRTDDIGKLSARLPFMFQYQKFTLSWFSWHVFAEEGSVHPPSVPPYRKSPSRYFSTNHN